MGRNEKVVLQTLLYSDIFNYPLTADEIWLYAISKKSISPKIIGLTLKKLENSLVIHHNGFFCLKGRSKIIQQRLLKEKESNKKINIAKKVVWFLQKIPTIQFIGLSGSVALKNAQKYDDIDLFFIVQNNSIWITRLLVFIVLEILRIGRRRKKRKVINMICPNMFLTLSSLEIPKEKRNIYIAHEVVQVFPLFDRSVVQKMFFYRNKWVLDFLPNSFLAKKVIIEKSFSFWLVIIEKIVKVFQIWYIKRHMTTEIISDDVLAFHPKNYHDFILGEYFKRIKKYNGE